MAAFSPRETLIPMVDGVNGGTLARIVADGELPPPHPAQLDPAISALLESGLYQAGQQACSAARRLRLRRRSLLGRPAVAMSVVNPGDIVGIGSENSASAELGLALALLLFQAQARDVCVLATGALGMNEGDEITVRPIHHLGRKLELSLAHFSQPGAARPPRYFFAPIADPDGGDTSQRYAAQIQALARLGIEFMPVSSLQNAVRILGIEHFALRAIERDLRRGLAVAGLCLSVTLGAQTWQNRPIEMHFATAVTADGAVMPTPARLETDADGEHLSAPCGARSEGIPEYAFGDQVATRLRLDDGSAKTRYGVILVAVSAATGIKVLAIPDSGAASRNDFSYSIAIEPPAEETLLVWLATRGRAIDPTALEARLRHSLEPLQASERISAARNLLSTAAPGVLIYYFRSVAEIDCPS